MIHLIPLPLGVRELGHNIPFSTKTKCTGDFDSVQETVVSLFPEAGKSAAENLLTFVSDDTIPKEGYRIACNDRDITIYASDEAGAFYGVMTILQLCAGNDSFPAVAVEDRPRYAHRGFMLDCARHFWSVGKIKQILDVMALLKMNVFHWHLSDDQGWRVEIKKYPLLTEKGSIRKSTPLSLTGYYEHKEPHDNTEYGRGLFYTQQQVREVVEYARQRFIHIIPEIDMPGHLVAAIACYPELSCTGEPVEVCDRWGVMENIGCCGKENIYRFARDVIDELCTLFPYPYFHIGGDEAPKDHWKVCPNCQAKIKELGLKDEEALQGYFNNVIARYLKSKGKNTVGWNEILKSTEKLDHYIIPQWWIPLDGSVREKEWLANGGKMILSILPYVYMDHAYAMRPLEKTYSFGPESVGIEDDTNILGIEAPQWTEYIRDEEKLDFNTFARLMAIAEAGWTDRERKNYPDFESRLESMRGYFASLGAPVPPAWIYRGDTIGDTSGMSEQQRADKAYAVWGDDPYFELKLAKNSSR